VRWGKLGTIVRLFLVLWGTAFKVRDGLGSFAPLVPSWELGCANDADLDTKILERIQSLGDYFLACWGNKRSGCGMR